MEAGKEAKAAYGKRLAEYRHELKERHAAEVAKKKAKKNWENSGEILAKQLSKQLCSKAWAKIKKETEFAHNWKSLASYRSKERRFKRSSDGWKKVSEWVYVSSITSPLDIRGMFS